MQEIEIHGFAPSTYTRTARMAAIEKSVPHRLVPLDYGTPAHLALHPFGKMPVLVEGGQRVFETLAILRRLDLLQGKPALFGTTPAEEVAVLEAVSAAIDYGYRALVQVELAAAGIDATQRGAAARVLDWLESRLDGSRHLTGEALSAADLFFAPMLAYHAAKIDAEAPFGPRLQAWLGTIRRRPSFSDTGEA